MQVQKIQNNNNTNFKASVADSSALRIFKSELKGAKKTRFDSYVKTITDSKDKKNYVLEYIQIGQPQKIRKIATISIQNKDKTIQHPPIFTDNVENTLLLFKKLAEKCAAYKK